MSNLNEVESQLEYYKQYVGNNENSAAESAEEKIQPTQFDIDAITSDYRSQIKTLQDRLDSLSVQQGISSAKLKSAFESERNALKLQLSTEMQSAAKLVLSAQTKSQKLEQQVSQLQLNIANLKQQLNSSPSSPLSPQEKEPEPDSSSYASPEDFVSLNNKLESLTLHFQKVTKENDVYLSSLEDSKTKIGDLNAHIQSLHHSHSAELGTLNSKILSLEKSNQFLTSENNQIPVLIQSISSLRKDIQQIPILEQTLLEHLNTIKSKDQRISELETNNSQLQSRIKHDQEQSFRQRRLTPPVSEIQTFSHQNDPNMNNLGVMESTSLLDPENDQNSPITSSTSTYTLSNPLSSQSQSTNKKSSLYILFGICACVSLGIGFILGRFL